jgi:epoxyqueuosine reductase QueG
VPTGERDNNRKLVDDVLSGVGIDLWGVAATAPGIALTPGFALAPDLPLAISLLARVDAHALTRLEAGDPTAYRAEYRRLNGVLDTAVDALVAALHKRGSAAAGAAATIYEETPATGDWMAAGVFAHKTGATSAGLGWIGKTGLFVSPEAGPKVRLATVFTDLDLAVGVPVTEGRCGSCHSCLDACPAGAGRDVTWHAGMDRDLLFDAAACWRSMEALGPQAHHTCGLCVAACPFGRVRSS